MENRKLSAAQTLDETEQDFSALSDRLEEMDQAEGVFGEVITDEELDLVAGGHVKPSNQPSHSGFHYREHP